MASSWFLKRLVPIATCTFLASVMGCGGGPATPPAPTVTVVHPIEQEVTQWDEFSGRLESPEAATIAAQVSGILVDTPFKEGSFVNKGDVLFVIDDRPFKAELDSKAAELAKAQAIFNQANAKYSRYEKIRGANAISLNDYDQAKAAFHESEASLAAAKAALDRAKLNLEWTHVTAPISGQVGRRLVTIGNLVTGGSGQVTQLTTITRLDPMYAYINVPERYSIKYRDTNESAQSGGVEQASIPCQYALELEDKFRTDCHIDFIDNHIDKDTGTLQLRGVIPNPTKILRSGLFVRIKVPSGKPYKTLLVPDIAIVNDQNARAVLVVNAENIVQFRSVKLGALFDNMRAISDGLTTGDQVIVAGVQLARPGTKVNPVPPADPSATPLPTAGAVK